MVHLCYYLKNGYILLKTLKPLTLFYVYVWNYWFLNSNKRRRLRAWNKKLNLDLKIKITIYSITIENMHL